MDAVEHDLTAAQWLALRTAWGGCAYCAGPDTAPDTAPGAAPGRALQRDCVLPISRGGRYTLANVVPACGRCNASKGNAEVTGWLRRLRLDEKRFLVRQIEILRALEPVAG